MLSVTAAAGGRTRAVCKLAATKVVVAVAVVAECACRHEEIDEK